MNAVSNNKTGRNTLLRYTEVTIFTSRTIHIKQQYTNLQIASVNLLILKLEQDFFCLLPADSTQKESSEPECHNY